MSRTRRDSEDLCNSTGDNNIVGTASPVIAKPPDSVSGAPDGGLNGLYMSNPIVSSMYYNSEETVITGS